MMYNEDFIEEKVRRLRCLQNKMLENSCKTEDISEANELAETLIDITKNTYNVTGEKYAEVRTFELLEFDKRVWNKLLASINEHIGKDYKNLKLLDVGTGHGRDLKYALDLGFDAIGVDNADAFITGLEKLASENIIPKNSFVKADMRNLPFEDNSFDIVRQQASLLHLPMVAKGYTVDKAIEENYRILKENGLLYVLVKKGDGIQYVDTNEGLGGRIFQFHNESTIENLVKRNGFKIIDITNEIEDRKGKIVEWIMIIAKKVV